MSKETYSCASTTSSHQISGVLSCEDDLKLDVRRRVTERVSQLGEVTEPHSELRY